MPIALLALTACSTTQADAVVGNGDVLVAGNVARQDTQTTFNGAFVATADAHVHIIVRRYEGEDAAAPMVAEGDAPYDGTMPFSFAAEGDSADLDGVTLLIEIRVLNHAGDTLVVGDLASEFRNEASAGQTDVNVTVSGVESCADPNAGGFCVK